MKDFPYITAEVTRRYIADMRKHLGLELSKTLNGWNRSRSIEKLSKASELFDSTLYSVEALRALIQIEAFYKKSSAFVCASSVRQAAIASFEKGERRCRITNRRLDYYSAHPHRINGEMTKRIRKMVRYIDDTLGPFSEFVRAMPELIRLTSGAASDSSRRDSTPARKLRRRLPCTLSAQPYLEALSQYFGYKVHFRTSYSNRIAFVPKNWKTERTIACEPVGNLPLQLAFDTFVKDRLRKKGINLSSQLKNQHLAKQGSIDGSYATLDLEAASDSLSMNAVAWLIPDDWFIYLNNVRSPAYCLNETYGTYAKFSSMGNGATFALETLVFAAACASVTDDFCVYGDDIIVPPDAVEPVIEVLRFFGFVVNPSKSHTTGSFRESCGVNCYGGIDITPFYLRQWREILTDFHHNINGLVSIATPGGELMEFLADLVRDRKDAIFTPQTESTISGIFLDITECYNRKLIRTYTRDFFGIPAFKGLVSKTGSVSTRDSRGLILWFLKKNFRASTRECSDGFVSSSSEPSAVQRYVRRMVPYIPATRECSGPVGRENAGHLYWWTEVLARRKAG